MKCEIGVKKSGSKGTPINVFEVTILSFRNQRSRNLRKLHDASQQLSRAVSFGVGDGTFLASTSYETDNDRSNGVAVIDLNGDGILDVATAGTRSGGRMAVLIGNSNGTFRAPVSYTMETTSSNSIAFGDVNNDGIIDAITAGNSGASAQATVRFGVGNGTFGASMSFATAGSAANAVTLGDINSDGQLDLIVAGANGSGGALLIQLGNGDGTFKAAMSSRAEDNTSYSVAVADFNGDGVLDTVSGGRESFSFPEGGISVLLASSVGVTTIARLNLRTRQSALDSMTTIDSTLRRISSELGAIGSTQSRLGVALSNVAVARENYAEAGSRITDVDVSEESAQLTRKTILQQAASAVLAQANQQPALALRLLGGG